MNARSLDAKRFNVTSTAPNGVVGEQTIFEFVAIDDARAEARYAGGKVIAGWLVGEFNAGRFRFKYAQLHTDGALAGGQSEGEIEAMPDGRTRLVERFTWDNGEPGENIIEELR